MDLQQSTIRRSNPRLVLALVGWIGLAGGLAGAQEAIPTMPAPAPQVVTAPPAVPTVLSLDACIAMAFEKQPALAAARASLAAAHTGSQALQNLRFAGLLSSDMRLRREQACVGVTISEARLMQAEWETRYAVTRNFYTVQYVRMQQGVVKDALNKLEKGRERAERLIKIGELTKITNIDLDIIKINIELLRAKATETDSGVEKALGALREAIGVGPECPLELASEPLPAVVTDFNKEALIAAALAARGEVTQAQGANRLTELEAAAQGRKFGIQVKTFAAGADIHAVPVPQGVSNTEYRPGAIGIEMPPFLIGRRNDRVQRAEDLNGRAVAVVDKTNNLIALEVDNYYLKWREAREKIERLAPIMASAKSVGTKVEERFREGNATGEEYLRATTLEDQVRAQYNEALYLHALALAALERATAGAYRINPATAAPHH